MSEGAAGNSMPGFMTRRENLARVCMQLIRPRSPDNDRETKGSNHTDKKQAP